MNSGDSDEDRQALVHENQPYDESLEVPDAEEIASTYSPTPRVPNPSGRALEALQGTRQDLGHSRGNSPPQSAMSDPSEDPYDDKPAPMQEPPKKEKAAKKGPMRRQALLSARSQKKAVVQEGEGQEPQPPANQVVSPQGQENPQPLLPKVPEGGKSLTASSLPQLGPKPPQPPGQGQAAAENAGGGAPPAQPMQQPQRPQMTLQQQQQMMMMQQQQQRMAQAPMMPRIPTQPQQQMQQQMPQMRGQQMTMQQATMRARAQQMYAGQMQMQQMAQMAYMQRMQMMQMQQMGYRQPQPGQQSGGGRGGGSDDDEDEEEEEEEEDDDDDNDDSEAADSDDDEDENMDEEEEEGEGEDAQAGAETVPAEIEGKAKEVETVGEKPIAVPPPTLTLQQEDGKKKKADAKKKDKQKDEKQGQETDQPKPAAKLGKMKKGKKRRLTTKHQIPPIRPRGVVRDSMQDLGESGLTPRPFGTPRDALPDIAGIKKSLQPGIQPIPAGRGQLPPQSQQFNSEDEDDDDDDDDDSDEDDDDDDHPQVEGAYDPAEFENLSVTAEIKELFQYITRYTPQSIELDNKLKPFIPDFIPSVGDIDAFIKIPRPDNKPDTLGLTVLDEPCAKQSDPTVLDLQLRAISKQTTAKSLVVKSLDSAEKNPKAIDNWIESIRELHRSKPPPNVHYSRNMPDIDTLMQEWPPEFEDLLKEISLPTADLDCDLGKFTEIICSILDIPVYKNSSHHNEKIQALHVLFTLYSEFKNSQHFQALAANNQIDNVLKDGQGDQVFL